RNHAPALDSPIPFQYQLVTPTRELHGEGRMKKQSAEKNEKKRASYYESARNSYSSMTAATAILLAGLPPSTRTTRPLQRTRMLSVSVISGGRVSVKSMAEPAWLAESTKKQIPRALTSRVCAACSSAFSPKRTLTGRRSAKR